MERNIIYDIIILLEKNPMHARAMATELETSHTTISRKLAFLEEDNVVEYVMEGKNKKYHLKNTIESKCFVIMSEYYAVARAVKYYPNLRNLINIVTENPEISMAILYGINPYEKPLRNGDTNLYIETKNDKIKYEIAKKYSKLNVKVGTWDPFNLHVKETINYHLVLKGIEKYIKISHIF
jgi:hypothetical protein